MDTTGLIHLSLFNDLQSLLSSAPFSPLLPPNRYSDGHSDEYSDNDMDYFDDEFNSDAIEVLQSSFNKPSSPICG